MPIYSFWHFDDFTWGETRKVDEGDGHIYNQEEKSKSHIVIPTVEKKLWHLWEQERLKSPGNRPQKFKRNVPKFIPPLPKVGIRAITVSPQTATSPIYPPIHQQPVYYMNNNNMDSLTRRHQQLYHNNNQHLLPPQPQSISILQSYHPIPIYSHPQQLQQNNNLQYNVNRRISNSFY